jgi:hypothetical protein
LKHDIGLDRIEGGCKPTLSKKEIRGSLTGTDCTPSITTGPSDDEIGSTIPIDVTGTSQGKTEAVLIFLTLKGYIGIRSISARRKRCTSQKEVGVPSA